MSVPFMEGISGAVDEINANSTLRTVVVTGTGKTFISGGDLALVPV